MQNFLQNIVDELYFSHIDYYWTVYLAFIEEAVENTIKDLKIHNQTITKELIETIHKHIKENYI